MLSRHGGCSQHLVTCLTLRWTQQPSSFFPSSSSPLPGSQGERWPPGSTSSRGRGWRGCCCCRLYSECQRGLCSPRTDRETNWEFDQPEPQHLDTEILAQLERGHRQVNIDSEEDDLAIKTLSLKDSRSPSEQAREQHRRATWTTCQDWYTWYGLGLPFLSTNMPLVFSPS